MPKLKTNKGAAKRFKKSKQGKIKRAHAYAGHLLGGKTQKRKRKLRKETLVHDCDAKKVAALLPYS